MVSDKIKKNYGVDGIESVDLPKKAFTWGLYRYTNIIILIAIPIICPTNPDIIEFALLVIDAVIIELVNPEIIWIAILIIVNITVMVHAHPLPFKSP